MKTLKLLCTLFLFVSITSCIVVNDDAVINDFVPLEEIISEYDLWYIDYNSGTTDIPYLSNAFTVSFFNGNIYANNNIVNIGKTGNGLGIIIGNYNTYADGVLETRHNFDGAYGFSVTKLSPNEIRLRDLQSDASYTLTGYYINSFDYHRVFYDNIEFFLQEYQAWEKVDAEDGTITTFDNENFLQFTPENLTTFYSSNDLFGTNIGSIQWDYVGNYEIEDFIDYDHLKFLTLYYQGGDTEEFELSVINDKTISLFNINTNRTYVFSGRNFIQYLKEDKKNKQVTVRKTKRKRTKITRKRRQR